MHPSQLRAAQDRQIRRRVTAWELKRERDRNGRDWVGLGVMAFLVLYGIAVVFGVGYYLRGLV